jgi:hypothetical protein
MTQKPNAQNAKPEEEKPVCGIIRPIAGTDDLYTSQHWVEIEEILTDVIEEIGYKANLVSNADYVNVIHERIVKNLYNNPIVICDVSSRNPNVMFELGMRLAFDMPTIVIKDDITPFNFDTSPIEHLPYSSSLHFPSIVKFKLDLKTKLTHTIKQSKQADYTTFLGNFRLMKREIQTENVTDSQYIINEIKSLSDVVNSMQSVIYSSSDVKNRPASTQIKVAIELSTSEESKVFEIADIFTSEYGCAVYSYSVHADQRTILKVKISPNDYNILMHLQSIQDVVIKRIFKIR